MKDKERLQKIFRKTDGNCHLCHKKLKFNNYGVSGSNGAWHIEHSVPKAKGGTDHMNNLYPACVNCNVEKGTSHTKTIRRKNGVTRAPYSEEKKRSIRVSNTTDGAVIGGGIGFIFAGPIGGLFGSIIGGAIGNSNSPEK